ncbi:MAG: ParA family protein [Parcubacteria group bacterium]|nr:ParA family protein [Parcubacteria group bacterium]
MARIIGIVNQKGGVGKTTTSINLGVYLAALGKCVLLVDLDPQGNTTNGLGLRLADDNPHLYHAIVQDMHPNGIIRKSGIFGFDILPAASELAGAQVELIGLPQREFQLKKALNKIRTNYDYILIDCPPSLGLLTVNGLTASEFILVPVQTEYFALEGLSQLMNTIELVKVNLNSELKVLGVLLTMYDKRMQLNREVLNEVKSNFPGTVFETVIPRQISLAEAPSFGKTILQYAPDSKGATAYRQLAQEVIKLTATSH